MQTGYFGASGIVSRGTSKYTRLAYFFFCLAMNLLTCVFVANKCALSQSRGLIGAVKILCAIQNALSQLCAPIHSTSCGSLFLSACVQVSGKIRIL